MKSRKRQVLGKKYWRKKRKFSVGNVYKIFWFINRKFIKTESYVLHLVKAGTLEMLHPIVLNRNKIQVFFIPVDTTNFIKIKYDLRTSVMPNLLDYFIFILFEVAYLFKLYCEFLLNAGNSHLRRFRVLLKIDQKLFTAAHKIIRLQKGQTNDEDALYIQKMVDWKRIVKYPKPNNTTTIQMLKLQMFLGKTTHLFCLSSWHAFTVVVFVVLSSRLKHFVCIDALNSYAHFGIINFHAFHHYHKILSTTQCVKLSAITKREKNWNQIEINTIYTKYLHLRPFLFQISLLKEKKVKH